MWTGVRQSQGRGEASARRLFGRDEATCWNSAGFAQRPQLLIVDQPTIGLEPEERVCIRNLLSDLSDERIVILSTHMVSDVEATATRIALVKKGKPLRAAASEDLLMELDGKAREWTVHNNELPALKKTHRQRDDPPKRWGASARCKREGACPRLALSKAEASKREAFRRISKTRTSSSSEASHECRASRPIAWK